ncbi:MAG: hypothetical protein U5O39_06395 [Gammaproteobacteria bacterium]|nr:hypothetical protein [Gammaproteobacteria bacterium]
MPKLGTRTMTGGSGNAYEFNVYPGNMVFNDFIPGVFAVCKDEDVLFMGESDNVDRAIQNNDKKQELEQKGFNRVCFHRVANPDKRKAAIDDLLKAISPPCN